MKLIIRQIRLPVDVYNLLKSEPIRSARVKTRW